MTDEISNKLSPVDNLRIDKQKDRFKEQEHKVVQEINKLLKIYHWDLRDNSESAFFTHLDWDEKLEFNSIYKKEVIESLILEKVTNEQEDVDAEDIIELLERLKKIVLRK